MRRLVALVLLLSLASALGMTSEAAAKRSPTYIERVTIMDTFNVPGRSFASKCVRILVSTANPRYAMLTSPVRIPADCRRAGQVGDGFVIFARATSAAVRWRNVSEGSGEPPCKVPRNVRIDLFGSGACV
jgi:hypothetical protein